MTAKLWTVLVFVASLALNGLAGTTILGGNTTAQVSDSYPNLFAPAGVTFAIWGVIYLLLIGFCVRLFVKLGKKHDKEADKLAVSLLSDFMTVSVLNAVWLLAWQYRVLWLSVIFIIAMLVFLVRINLKTQGKKLNLVDWATINLPFSVYFGWVTVATIANITVWLVSIGWNGGGIAPETWTVTILVIGAAVGMFNAWRMKNAAYVAVFVWAYFGIWLKHTSTVGHNLMYPTVIFTLGWLLAALVMSTAWLGYAYPKGIERK